jgi:hypothetical protein
LPAIYDGGEVNALFWGINAVGIWDEFFFVSTVFAILRSLYPFWLANLAQAVVYTAVLYDMAFIGVGPVLVYLFALTQGSMFEKSDNLPDRRLFPVRQYRGRTLPRDDAGRAVVPLTAPTRHRLGAGRLV